MANCRGCGKVIPDGADYCDECLSQLNTAKEKESYLDSLLNSVLSEQPAKGEAGLREKKTGSLKAVSEIEEDFDEEDIPEFGADLPKFEDEDDDIPEFGTDLPKFEEDIPEFGADSPKDDVLTEQISEFGADVAKDEPVPEDIPEFGAEDAKEEPASEADAIENLLSEFGAAETEEQIPEFGADAGQEDIPDFGADAGLDALLNSFGQDTPEGDNGNAAENEGNTSGISGLDADLAELLSGFGSDTEEFGADMNGFGQETEKTTDSAPAGETKPAEEKSAAKKKKKEKKDKLEKGEKEPGKFAKLWHKLFDNVKVDPSKIKPKPTPEEIAAKKKAAEEAKAKSKEEKEAAAAEKKESAKREKEEKQRKAKAVKEEKKARKLEEAKLLLEEMETTRINRTGAAIVFIFFAMIAVVIIVGTSIFSYSISIRNAEYEFNRDEYTAAYNEIFGLDVKDEDIMLYDRIMTVMYVQKQLNSYYNYYEMKDYPRALDSLLKGLQRYEKYIELAIELDIETDLDSVRNSILAQAEATFMLSEREAMEIIQAKNQLEYSEKVYKAAESVVVEEVSE